MSWLGSAYSQRPSRQEHAGPQDMFYAYGSSHDYGVQGGFGLQSAQFGSDEGFHASSDLLSANGFFGGRQESDGSVSHGWGASGKVAGINMGYGQQGQGNFFDFQADALGGDIGAHFNPDQGANLGATAYLAQAAIQGGDIGTDHNDSYGRIGLAAGVGAAGRLHWDDSDNDGYREYGFGADIGPLTFDVKSEDPVADWIPGMGLVRDLTGTENLTHSIGSGISAGWDAVSGAAGAVGSFVGGIFSGW